MSILAHMVFRPDLARAIGIEQEFFLVSSGVPVPLSHVFLVRAKEFDEAGKYTYELSGCQVEYRTAPHQDLTLLRQDLEWGQETAKLIASLIGCGLAPMEVAPPAMPLAVYPYDARYAMLSRDLPEETLRSACRVAGIHVHIGCRDIDDALSVHNTLVPHLELLQDLGDHSRGERLRLYRDMAANWRPPLYASTAHFESVAQQEGFENNPKNCWHLIRITRYGTVEVRVFGNTGNIGEIMSWVQTLRMLIR